MKLPATESSAVLTAYHCYGWLKGAPANPVGLEAVHRFLGTAISLEDLQRLDERLRDNPRTVPNRGSLIARWDKKIAASRVLSEAQALALIQELLDGFDHSLLYDSGVTAGFTQLHRGGFAHLDKRFPGVMPCWTLHYTVKGRALFLSDSMERDIEAGALMLLQPNARYHYGLHPKADEWAHLWALFQPRSHWDELLDWPELDAGIACLKINDMDARKRIESLFREIVALHERDSGASTELLQYNRLEELFIRAGEFNVVHADRRIDPRISHACAYIRERLATPLLVDEVAHACNLSSSRFAHLFKQEMGTGPKAWINDMRLQLARKLLIGSDDSISAIGAKVGFTDPGHFTRHFKNNVGCNPRQFRKSFAGQSSAPGMT